ncbi:MAG: glycosyltransferase family 4 protein [Pseudomonadales bacterium]
MKTVWLLNHYAAAPTDSGGTRHHGLARHAAGLGYRIIIVAASVEHFTGRQRLRNDEKTRFEVIDGVSFLWIRTTPYSGNGWDRIRNMLEYTWRAMRRSTTAELPAPCAVIGSSVHPLAALAAQRIASRHGVPFVFEIRDLWPETLIAMNRIGRHGIVAIALRTLERWLCRSASRIIVLLPHARDYLREMGVESESVVWIPNGVDLETFPCYPLPDRSPLTVMYLGAHGTANGLDRILDAIHLLARGSEGSRFRFRFVGDGPMKDALVLRAKALGISDQVSFEPAVSKAALPELAAQADIFVMNVRDLELYRYGFSFNKLFDYMAAARPIVFAGPRTDNPVAQASAGIVVDADDAKGMASGIVDIAGSSLDARREMGSRGRRLLESDYAQSILARRLGNCLKEVGI